MPTIPLLIRISLGLHISLCCLVGIFQLHDFPPIDHRGNSVRRADLVQAIERADELIVHDVLLDPVVRPIIWRSTATADRLALIRHLSVQQPSGWYRCQCDGSHAISLVRDGREYGVLSTQHGEHLRWSGWDSDAPIRYPERWADWFRQRGMDLTRH